MKKSFVFVLLLFVVALFFGCGSQKKAVVVQPKELPSWYTSAPRSTDTQLYALGEGANKEEAIANALSMMASTLSVSISSDFRAQTVVKEGRVSSVDRRYESDLQSRVKEMRIAHYELLHAESLGFKRYGVLVRSNKKKLYESMLQETRQEFAMLEQREKSIANANGLQKLSFYKESLNSLKSLPHRIIVMSLLESSFDGKEYLERMQRFESEQSRLLSALSFYITTTQNARNLQAVVEKGLNQQKIRVASSGASAMHFTTQIVANIQRADAYGFVLARSEIEFVTRDNRGRVVGSNRVNIVGQSSQGFEIAKQDLALRLDKLVQDEGIGSLLGLDI